MYKAQSLRVFGFAGFYSGGVLSSISGMKLIKITTITEINPEINVIYYDLVINIPD